MQAVAPIGNAIQLFGRMMISTSARRLTEFLTSIRKEIQTVASAKKDICRNHILTAAEATSLNLFTKQLNYVVDELGKSVVGSVDTMVRFVGWSDEGESDTDAVVVFALLVDARFSPKMQYFVKCGLPDDPGCVGLLNKSLPFVV